MPKRSAGQPGSRVNHGADFPPVAQAKLKLPFFCEWQALNAIGNIGGFAGPYLTGWIRQATRSFSPGLVAVAASVLFTGISAFVLGHDRVDNAARCREA
jgi:hypothetical protein